MEGLVQSARLRPVQVLIGPDRGRRQPHLVPLAPSCDKMTCDLGHLDAILPLSSKGLTMYNPLNSNGLGKLNQIGTSIAL